ncbi:gliding motility-associated C-terminal domain-containing protein [Agaribacillus aureus]|uniref:T9SS type B sorting domain-containing protein n=1 Tax=Agaribacillus aureus TaxID=3051825 RepID=UPI003211BAF1
MLWLPHHNTLAQHASAGGRFEADYIKGCAPLTVNITQVGLPGLTRTYDYDRDGLFEGNLTTYTFTAPGTYTILEIVANQIPRADSITIEVIEPLEPEYTVRNCANNNVKIDITDTYYDRFFIDFGDGTNLTVNRGDNVPPHNYGVPNSYTITVRGIMNGANDNCAERIVNINTVNNLVPASINSLNVTTIDPGTGSLVLSYSLNPDIVYELEQAVNEAQNFQMVEVLTEPTLKIVENLNTQDNYYCYRIRATDVCSATTIYSDTICSIVLDAVAQDNNNSISWTTENLNFSNYTVIRDNNPISVINNAAQTRYDDSNVICNQDYCYQLVNNYANGLISTSGQQCVTAFSTDIPDPIQEITSSVVNNEINITWDIPANETPARYFIRKSVNNEPSAPVDTVDSNNYIDNDVNIPANTYCYNISYEDQCGNTSLLSPATCPIILTGSLESNNQVSLTWTDYQGWSMGVNQYFVDVFDNEGNLLGSVPVGNTLSFLDDALARGSQILFYQIRAVSNDATPRESVSNIFRVQLEVLIFLPNAFTPNGDGLNDFFEAKGLFFQSFSMKIFNRWGELIFVSDNADVGWDGTFNGKLMPEATYVYRVDVTDFTGLKSSRSGGVLLLRK